MIKFIKKRFSETNPVRLVYHKVKAVLAAVYYGFPSRRLNVIAVTGTKGKTTTVNLIANILTEAGYKVGATSTTNFQIGDLKWNNVAKMTTLGPFFMQKMLRQMVRERCTHAVLEVSSHAILQNRIWGIDYDMAVLTNVGEDHLEYHGGFENYLRTKGLLFSRLMSMKRKPRIQKIAVLNKDDLNYSYFEQFTVDRRFTFGMSGGTCSVGDMQLKANGSKFLLKVPNNAVEISMKLPGEFNVNNALAAATVAMANNVGVQTIKDALEKSSTIPGRYEIVEGGQKYNIVVDYAHTAESLDNLLELYKYLTPGRLFAVFGATGGGRDRGKRVKMGEAADKHADFIVVTDDDPYEEDRWQIVEDISRGIKRVEGESFWKIPTREEAIKMVLAMAKEGDTVVFAGKGAEEVQMLRKGPIPWDDRQVIRSLLGRTMKIEIKPGKIEEKENVYIQS